MSPILKILSKESASKEVNNLFRYFNNLSRVHYGKGECIPEIDLNSSIIFIEKGKGSLLNNEHQEMIYQEQFVYAGSFANLETAFNRDAYKNCHLKIEIATIIKKVSFTTFNTLIKSSIPFNQTILQLLANRARHNQRKVNRLRHQSTKYRIINYLWELAKEKGRIVGFEIVIDLPPTQQEIAISASAARQTVATLLTNLRKENVIYYNRRSFIFRNIDEIRNILKAG